MGRDLSFLKDDDMNISGDVLKRLSELARAQLDYEEEVKRLEEELKNVKDALNRVSREAIPNLLKSRGLSRVKLANGMTIEVKDDAEVSVKDNARFFEWLTDRKSDDIIKTLVSIDRMPQELHEKLYNFMDSADIPYSAEKKVHPQTLKKFFRTLCGLDLTEEEREVGYMKGTLVPTSEVPDFCSVFAISKTVIKK